MYSALLLCLTLNLVSGFQSPWISLGMTLVYECGVKPHIYCNRHAVPPTPPVSVRESGKYKHHVLLQV